MRYRWLSVLFAFLSTGAPAQWLNFPTPGTPRTRDGKPNLAAPAPRAAMGSRISPACGMSSPRPWLR
jgi:hypothetical protein